MKGASSSSYYEPNVQVSSVTFKSFIKLSLILSTYISVFVSVVQLAFWLFESREVDNSTPLWATENYAGLFLAIFKNLAVDMLLLSIFAIQHTCMSQKRLIMSTYWKIVHYEWECDKAIYNLMTAVALQIIISWWQPVGLYLWKFEFISASPINIQFLLHIFAWAAFYGTNLMLDLPDLIGLTQVVITCENKVVKSPELQSMIENQRHMGLLPLLIILLAHPCMSLDRALLAVATLAYTYKAWRSESCYPYATSMKQVKKKQQFASYNGKKYVQD